MNLRLDPLALQGLDIGRSRLRCKTTAEAARRLLGAHTSSSKDVRSAAEALLDALAEGE